MEIKTENNPKIEKTESDQDESTPLFMTTDKSELKDSILVRTVSFGLSGFFLAAHMAANSKFLALLGQEGVGAGAIISPYYSFVISGSTGILLSTGLEMGPHVGKRNFKRAGDIAKSSWLLTVAVGGVATGMLIGTRGILPLIVDEKIATIAADFFSSYLTTIPLLMITTSSQIAFQAGDWFIPPVAMFSFFTTSALSSYLFAFNANMGAFGIGLGGTVASVSIFIGLQSWFLREKYHKFHLYDGKNFNIKENILKLLSSGWKLSFQKLSEWMNLMLITLLIGLTNEQALKAAHPGNVYIILVATAFQDIAQGAGMLIARNRGAMFKALEKLESYNALDFHKKNRNIVLQNNVFSILVSLVLGGAFYFTSGPVTDFFLSQDSDDAIKELSKKLLWINLLGLIPDGVRITTSGALRGWQDILYPTLVSLIVIIGLGIPAGYGLGELFDDEASFLFFVRDLAMAIAGGIIINRCVKKESQDRESVTFKEPSEPSCAKSFFRFFKKNNRIVNGEEANESELFESHGSDNS